MIKRKFILVFSLLAILLVAGCAQEKPQPTTTLPTTTAAPPATVEPPNLKLIALGGRLYDKWWKETGGTEPAEDHSLWATQTTNTRSGSTTWRCKECHAWDYKGKDGAYGSGSHFTGFTGIFDAAQTKTAEELTAAMKGATNPDHDFTSTLTDEHIEHVVLFLKNGLVDMKQYIDYSTKKAIGGDVEKGKGLYEGTCSMCHGTDGKMINFGSDEKPKYVGTVANENPQETLHKVRSGQPGTTMSSAIVDQWTVQDEVDLLAYTQSLPE